MGRVNKPVMDYEGNEKRRTQVTSIRDKPVIEVISPENLRIDPASDWADPLESTPYIIHLIPMYLQDVRGKMDSGEWNELSDGELLTTTSDEDDNTTRLVRDEPREDPLDNDAGYGEVEDYKIIWVHKNGIRKDGEDFPGLNSNIS